MSCGFFTPGRVPSRPSLGGSLQSLLALCALTLAACGTGDAEPGSVDAQSDVDIDAGNDADVEDTDGETGDDADTSVHDTDDTEAVDTTDDADTSVHDTDDTEDVDASEDADTDSSPDVEDTVPDAGPCAPGSVRCQGTVWELCNAESEWTTGADCAATEQWCDEGACADRVCDPGAPATCGDDDVVRCLPDGSGFETVEVCDENGCADGECLGFCGDDVAAGEEECDGDDLRGAACADFPDYGSGSLGCSVDCTRVFDGCTIGPRVDGLSAGRLELPFTPEGGFGRSIAVYGDRVLVGASGGMAYLFAFDGEDFVHERSLDPDLAIGSAAGYSAAFEDDLIVLGAPGSDIGFSNRGAVVGFAHDGEDWSRVGVFGPTDPDAGDTFGEAVAIASGFILVGVPRDDEKATDAGAVQVFELNEGSFDHVTDLYASDASSGARFGSHIAVDGDRIIIGAVGDGAVVANGGAAYVFERSGDTWVERHKLTPNDPTTANHFGVSAAFSGSLYYIGHRWSSLDDIVQSGVVEAFDASGESPAFRANVAPISPVAGASFGSAVAALGRTVAVGAPEESGGGTAYVFVDDGDSWRQVRRIPNPGESDTDAFGIAVAFSNGYVLIGAAGDREVWIYR